MTQFFNILLAGLLCLVIGLFNWLPPALANADPLVWRQQIIYLLIPDRFANGRLDNDHAVKIDCPYSDWNRMFHGGDFAGLKQHVDYFKELGVTTVWSTPIYEQVPETVAEVGCGFHGYWPNYRVPDTGLIEPRLGTDEEFSELLRSLDNENIRYILDVVVNHTGFASDLLAQRPDWFRVDSDQCQKSASGLIQCPSPFDVPDLWRACLKDGPIRIYCPLFGLPDLIQENPEVAQYLIDIHQLFLKKFPQIDGIRVDTVRHVELNFFSDVWLPAMRQVRPDLFLEGEILYGFPAVPEQVLTPYLRAGFDSVFNFPLRSALGDTVTWEGSVNLVADRVQETIEEHGLAQALMMTNLLDNHDMPRLTSEIEQAVGPATIPENADEIRDRYHLALSLLFTLPGIPQIYYGDELGMLGGEEPLNRRDMPDWAWSPSARHANPNGQKFLGHADQTFQYVQHLIQIRRDNPALYQGYFIELFRQWGLEQPNVYVFLRGDGDNRIIVIWNNGMPTDTMTLQLQGVPDVECADPSAFVDGMEWVELLGSGAPSKLQVQDGHMKVQMPAKTVGIYRLDHHLSHK